MDPYIRNREGRIIGRFDGSWLRDGVGNLVAKTCSDGLTRNREGFIVGKGDQRLVELGKRLDKK